MKLPSIPARGAALAALCLAAALPAQTIQWTSGTGANGHYYQLVAVASGGTWTAANTAAQNAGGYLATLTSVEENTFVYDHLASLDASVWFIDGAGNSQGPALGGFESGGTWSWTTGETWSFTNWSPGEPNNFGGNEHYLEFFGSGSSIAPKWNDIPDNSPIKGYLVEYDAAPIPEPAPAAALLSLAALGLARRNRLRAQRAFGLLGQK